MSQAAFQNLLAPTGSTSCLVSCSFIKFHSEGKERKESGSLTKTNCLQKNKPPTWMLFSFKKNDILKVNYHVSQGLSVCRFPPLLKMEWVLLWVGGAMEPSAGQSWFQVMWTRASSRHWHREWLVTTRLAGCSWHSGPSWELSSLSSCLMPLWDEGEQCQCQL